MKFDNIREILSFAADYFGKKVFECDELERFIPEALDESGKWHQRRCILNASFVVRFVIMLMLFRHYSILIIKDMLLMQFRHWFPDISLESITPEAFCHARERLGKEPLRLLFEKLAAVAEPYSLFHGFPVVGVDGTKVNIPDTPKNEAFFGRPDAARAEASHPQMLAVSLVETSTRQVRGVEFMTNKSSERDGFSKIIEKLPENALVLMDRGISAIWLQEQLLDKSKHFLCRLSNSWKCVPEKRLGDGDFLVSVQGRIHNPGLDGRKMTRQMTLRMITYRVGEGETIRLLTDLTDHKKYSAIELAELYHQRGECELAYDELKTHLSATAGGAEDLVFRSKSPEGILQEGYALFALYNIIRGLMAKAGKLHDVNPLDISFVRTVHIIRRTMDFLLLADSDSKRSRVIARMLRDIADTVNIRPRRNRKCSRVVKKKMSNYLRKTGECSQRLINTDINLILVG